MNTKLQSLAAYRIIQVRFYFNESRNSLNGWIFRNSDKIMFVGGVLLIGSALTSSAVAQGDMDSGPIDRVIQIVLNDMIGGSFGALIMIVAGLVAIISASMGAYRAAMSALVVAVGAFVLRSIVSAFWPDVDYGS